MPKTERGSCPLVPSVCTALSSLYLWSLVYDPTYRNKGLQISPNLIRLEYLNPIKNYQNNQLISLDLQIVSMLALEHVIFQNKITTNVVWIIEVWKFKIWKMVKHCCYGGCTSNSKRHDVKFIPFVKPTSNLQRCRRWVHLCGRDSKIFNYSKITKVS